MKIRSKKYIYRYMRLRTEWVDIFMKCPFTNVMINTTFIKPEMYQHYINKGFGYMFIDEDRKSEFEMDDIDEIEIKPSKK